MSDPINLVKLGMPTPLAVEVAAMIDASTAPVTSVNGATGVVVLDAGDVGAVASVNGNTGTVVLDADDVGALPEPTPAAAIPDLALTGTYETDDDSIESAVNDILAVLRANGFVTP